MGLPMWRVPSPEAGDALKVDRSAQARSPIRRGFATRRARPSRSPRSPRVFDHDFFSFASHADSISRSSSGRRPAAPPAAPELRPRPREVDIDVESPALSRPLHESEASMAAIRARRETVYRSMFEQAASITQADRLGRRPPPALTPNFAPAAASRDMRTDAPTDRDRTFTFARRAPHPAVSARSRGPWSPYEDNLVLVDDGEDDGGDNAVGFPPLRRMGRRTIADGPLPSSSLRESWSPATTLDGLGDRERSMSPIEDHWDTMLSTVAPDPLAPSADSSFTSAAASASFSNSHPSSRAGSANSNSASSSRTHLTVPSRRDSPPSELFMRACDTSDDDTASDTEEEEDTTLRPNRSSLRRRHRQGYADEPPSRDPNRYSRGVRDRSREASAYVRSFYGTTSRNSNPPPERSLNDQLDGPADSLGEAELDALDQELRDARAILERLAQRQDISDDFWTSVGLTRPLADRVNRLQQFERFS